MKIVIAMDSFKGGLSAENVCRSVAQGLRDVDANVEIVEKPMADGGEGTAAALLAARSDGEWIPATVTGPLPPATVAAGYAWFASDRTAVIEMAVANGLPLLSNAQRNPLLTSTFGTGQLIAQALEKGARHILLAIGGSATVDGGVGAARALGWQFLDATNRPIGHGGGALQELARIVPPDPNGAWSGVNGKSGTAVTVLCDVTNPLLGDRGAATVFGPQKGATPAMIPVLEAGLTRLADMVEQQLGIDMRQLKGGGAAGGLGGGAAAFFGADLAPGIDTIIQAANLRQALQGADACLTGEGSFDTQSLHGKVVSGVAKAAKQAGVPVSVIAGRVKADPADYQPYGIEQAIATHAPDMPMEEVIRRETELLSATASQWLRQRR